MKPLRLLLVGIGGYGNTYVELLKRRLADGAGEVAIAGVADPLAERAPGYAWLQSLGVPFYDSPEAFYAQHTAELAVISTPIPLHGAHCACALKHGSHVLVEKPLCPTIQEAAALAALSRETGRFLAVGFQWSYSAPILALKRDILAGRLGRPITLKSYVSWQRFRAYYTNSWRGRRRDGQGRLTLDCVLTNATAHYLHNLFFLAGASGEAPALDRAETPDWALAEAYRVKPDMEMPDLFVLRGGLPCGADFWYGCSYSLAGPQTTRFHCRYEYGEVLFNEETADDHVRARFADGSETDYGNPQTPQEIGRKLDACIRAAMGDRIALTCTAETAMPHIRTANSLLQALPGCPVPPDCLTELTDRNGDGGVFAAGLDEALLGCYRQGRLPGEAGLAWSMEPTMVFPGKCERWGESK